MAKPLKMPIVKEGNSYRISVPARYSSTGKRQRQYFETFAKATFARQQIMDRIRVHGHQALTLSPGTAEAVMKSLALLERWDDASILDAVRFYADHRERQEKAVSFKELWQAHSESREAHSDTYQRDIERTGRAILPLLGAANVGTITAAEIEKAMREVFQTPTAFNNAFRTIRPAFTAAIRKGYRTDNPFDRIEKRRQAPKEIVVMTIHQARAALEACSDQTANIGIPEWCRVDASDALPAVAIMLFAGVRPKEITRLRWEDVRFDHESIRIRGKVSKTRSARIIPMTENLVAWLETVEKSRRHGLVVPSRWKECIAAVRACAGVSDLPDVFRHTCASMHLAAFNDVSATREILGHETSEMLFKHYRALVPKQDAVQFWGLFPGETISLRSVSGTRSSSEARISSGGPS